MRALVIAFLLAACGGSSHAETPPQPADAPPKPAPAASEGADPDLNRRFLDPELDVRKWTKRFEGESREVYAHRQDVVRALRIRPGMSIADIGAGTGLFEGLFDAAVGDGGSVYAVDISPRFLDHLRRRKRRDGWKRVTVVKGGSSSPNLPSGSVDLVFVCDTYHHFTDVPAMLAAISNALRPGGRLVVVDFHRIPGVSKKWIFGHVRAGMKTFKAEIEAAGFRYGGELSGTGLEQNYAIEFHKPAAR